MRMVNKLIRFIGSLLLVLIFSIITNVPHRTLAAELPQNEPGRNVIDVNILQLKENLTEGMLEIPEDVQKKIILYQLIMGGVERYVSETGREEVSFCDLENDLLYGDKEIRQNMCSNMRNVR